VINYGWTWKGVYSYHVAMAWWVLAVLIAIMVTATVIFALNSSKYTQFRR
jgi:hypothetical protein